MLHTSISLLAKIVGVAGTAFIIYSILSIIPSRKRIDRSLYGEILGVSALTFTSPAAYAINTGHIDKLALLLWGISFLYFASGVFFVKMFLQAIRIKGEMTIREKWDAGKASVIYHILLMVFAISMLCQFKNYGAVWLLMAYVPIICRGLYGFTRLTNKPPSFTQVGIGEAIYATWFTIAISIAFNTLRYL